MNNLDIVIVTYNRLEKLKKALRCYSLQTASFRNLVVVNNCSTDGTAEYLEKWIGEIKESGSSLFTPIIITTSTNSGGSGGFYLGEKKAMELGADWVFVADDDAYAAPDMVERFYEYIETHDTSKTAAVCAAVHNIDGSVCLYHRDTYATEKVEFIDFIDCFAKKYVRNHSVLSDYDKESFSVDILSYVGSFLNAQALRKVGLVNPNYFIYYDDTEHSFRLRKYGNIDVVPAIKITHEGGAASTKAAGNVIVDWRSYYLIRNDMHMRLKYLPRTVIQKYWLQLRCTIGAWLHHPEVGVFERVERTAMWDAFFGRLGEHKLYRPGWKVLKEEASN